MSINKLEITENTYSIHHFSGSWLSKWAKFKRLIRKLIGPKIYNKLYQLKNTLKNSRICCNVLNKNRILED